MSMKLLTAAMAGLAYADTSVTIQENGSSKQLWAVGSKWAPTSGTQGGFSLPHSGRTYLGTKDGHGSFSPDMFYSPNLLGGSIEWDMDLSQAGCGCNAAFYLISMPGYKPDGSPDPSQGGDYYCDANQVGGVYCPEMDIMEANTYAWHTTPHTCDAPQGKHYWNCDRGGCGKPIHQVDGSAYGPGNQYRINTLKPFNAKMSFNGSNGSMSSIVLDLKQGSNSFQMTIADRDCAGGYLDNMGKALEAGMTLSVSNWGQPGLSMSWLDGDTGCNEWCGNNPTITTSNIKYTTSGHGPVPPPPPPPPPSGDYVYGSACAGNYDDDCNGCSQCDWSWPRSDPAQWNSKDAKCRCKN